MGFIEGYANRISVAEGEDLALHLTAATTNWADGLAKDPIVQRITTNVLKRLSR